MSEEELIDRIKKNPEALSELFRQFYKAIFGYVFRRIGIFEVAAEVSAETFAKAFQNINRFDYRGIPVKVWLYRIASNEINLYFRNKKKYTTLLTRLQQDGQFAQYIQDDRERLEAELQVHQQYLLVVEQLKTLSIPYQEVIALRYFEGKNNKEIAEILDIKEGTIKSLLSRGLERLRMKCNQL